jgi:hypothetical protein
LPNLLADLLAFLLIVAAIRPVISDYPVHYVVTVPGTGGVGVAFLAEFAISFGLMAFILFTFKSPILKKYTGIETSIFGYFNMVRAALPHLKKNDTIVNTSSILGLIGKEFLIDYSAGKGAVNAFPKALAQNLAERKIRVRHQRSNEGRRATRGACTCLYVFCFVETAILPQCNSRSDGGTGIERLTSL